MQQQPQQSQQSRQYAPQGQQYQACIDACLTCAQACEMCASACLCEQNVGELTRCIRMNQDCATLCLAAATIMARDGEIAEILCRLCADVCDACGAECARYSMAHCQTCARACKACADECRKMSSRQPRRAQGAAEAAH